MESLVIIGAIISLLGLIGLLYCIVRALTIKREGGNEEQMRAKLQPLIAWNFGAVALSILGLMFVVIGVIL